MESGSLLFFFATYSSHGTLGTGASDGWQSFGEVRQLQGLLPLPCLCLVGSLVPRSLTWTVWIWVKTCQNMSKPFMTKAVEGEGARKTKTQTN